jgi:hypothetical protein
MSTYLLGWWLAMIRRGLVYDVVVTPVGADGGVGGSGSSLDDAAH